MSEVSKEEMFPSNSISNRVKTQEPKKEIQKITTGKVSVKKPGLGKKIADTFLEDDVEHVKTYLVKDVVIPAIKDTIVDVGCSALEMIFGSRGRAFGRKVVSKAGERYTNYASISYKGEQRERPRRGDREPMGDISQGIIVETRAEAEDVIFRLADLVDQYQMATVADLYSLCGMTGDFQSNKWGWESVAGARAVRQRGGGFLIDMPKPIYLE